MARVLSAVAQAFRQAASADFSQFLVEAGGVIFRVPAAAEEVGDLTITDDGDRLTCFIGQIDHQHFEVECPTGVGLKRAENLAASYLVQWVSDVIHDKVQFRIQKHRGRVICGGWYPAGEDPGPLLNIADEWIDYRWSGQVSVTKKS